MPTDDAMQALELVEITREDLRIAFDLSGLNSEDAGKVFDALCSLEGMEEEVEVAEEGELPPPPPSPEVA